MDGTASMGTILRPGFGVRTAARRATAWARMLPTCVIIGAQKSGTTSLYRYLSQHPEIGASSRKEVHYFDQAQGTRSELWYRAHFPLRGRYRYAIESSPYYLFHPLVPERLSAVLPDAKLLVVLRDPVARAYSHYHHVLTHVRAHTNEELDFVQAIAAEQARLEGEHERLLHDPTAFSITHRRYSYVSRGLYAAQLERWYEHFDRDQLLILESETLFEDPAATLSRVQDWLRVSAHTPGDLEPKNTRSYDSIDPSVAQDLRARFEADRVRLESLTGMSFRWPRLRDEPAPGVQGSLDGSVDDRRRSETQSP